MTHSFFAGVTLDVCVLWHDSYISMRRNMYRCVMSHTQIFELCPSQIFVTRSCAWHDSFILCHDFFLTDVFWLKCFSHVPHTYFSHNPHFSKTANLRKNELCHTYEWVISRTCSCESWSRHFRTNQQTSGNCTYLSGKTNKIEYICEDGLAGGQADNGVYYLAKFLECVCVLQCVSVCCSVL